MKIFCFNSPLINCFSGYWNIIVYGRKHSYRLYTKMLNEAMRWTAAIQGVIDSKTPIETPTLQLIRDIKVKHTQRHYWTIFKVNAPGLILMCSCSLRRTAWTQTLWSKCTGGTPSSDTRSTLCIPLYCHSLTERSPAVSTRHTGWRIRVTTILKHRFKLVQSRLGLAHPSSQNC